jgi:hypothetical protein
MKEALHHASRMPFLGASADIEAQRRVDLVDPFLILGAPS